MTKAFFCLGSPAFAKSLAENQNQNWVISKKKKRLHNNLVAKNKKVLELSQIQNGFAKMFKWHQNSLGNLNFKLISEKLESFNSNSNSTLICDNQKYSDFILL